MHRQLVTRVPLVVSSIEVQKPEAWWLWSAHLDAANGGLISISQQSDARFGRRPAIQKE